MTQNCEPLRLATVSATLTADDSVPEAFETGSCVDNPAKEYRYPWRLAVYPSIPFLLAFLYCLSDMRYSYFLLFVLIHPVAAELLLLLRIRIRVNEQGFSAAGLFGTATVQWDEVKRVESIRFPRRLRLTAAPPAGPYEAPPVGGWWRGMLRRLVREMKETRIVVGPAVEGFSDLVSHIRSHVSKNAPHVKLGVLDARAKGPPSPVRRIAAKGWLLVGLLPVVILAAVFFSLDVRTWRLEERARALEQRIAAAGQPINGLELEGFRVPDDESNAAPVFLAAGALLKGLSGEAYESVRTKLNDPSFTIPEAHMQWARDLVAKNELVVQVLNEAESRGDCGYSVEYSEGLDAAYSHLPPLRRLCQFLVIRNFVRLDDPESDPVENIHLVFEVVHSLRNQPTFLDMLVRQSCQGYAFAALRQTLRRRTLSATQLAAVTEKIDGELESMSLESIFIGERALLLQATDSVWDGLTGEHPFLGPLCTRNWESRPLLSPFKLLSIGSRIPVMEVCEGALALERAGDPMRYDARISELFARILRNRKWYEIGSSLMFVMSEHMPAQYYSTVAALQAAKTAICIETFRARTGELPGRLDEVEAALNTVLPKDPFTGESLVFRRTEHGYIVYSLGVNGKDDGGEDSRDGDRLDVAFEVLHD